MAYFPLFVDLEGANVLIVGGGATAHRKLETLLDFGAEITVVAPRFTGDFSAVQTIKAEFSPELLEEKPYALVIAATNSPEVNHDVFQAAKTKQIPVNSVDDRENCTFYFPAVLKSGDVVVGISSGGKSPLVAQYVKALVQKVFPDTIGAVNDVMGEERNAIRTKIPGTRPEDQKRRASYLRNKLKELL